MATRPGFASEDARDTPDNAVFDASNLAQAIARREGGQKGDIECKNCSGQEICEKRSLRSRYARRRRAGGFSLAEP